MVTKDRIEPIIEKNNAAGTTMQKIRLILLI